MIAVLAANDPFVMSGWGRFEGLEDKVLDISVGLGESPLIHVIKIITLSDTNAAWSKSLGMAQEDRGMGFRTRRYAIIVDDLVVKYVEVKPPICPQLSHAIKPFYAGRTRPRRYSVWCRGCPV